MIRLKPRHLEAIHDHAARGYPKEVCGLVVGITDCTGAKVAISIHECRNRGGELVRDRFELDPGDYLRVQTDADAAGSEVVGVYHSHPGSAPEPSATDLAHAQPVYSYLIVGPGGEEEMVVRSFVLDEAAAQPGFREEVVDTADSTFDDE